MAHPYCHKWQDSLLFMAKKLWVCLHVLYPLITVRLSPCPGYYEDHCNEYGPVDIPLKYSWPFNNTGVRSTVKNLCTTLQLISSVSMTPHPWILPTMDHLVNSHISGPVQVKPVSFKGQLYWLLFFWIYPHKSDC